jgi:hypothetical protein
MTIHVMIDLETWGTAPGSALRSIGAVTFDPYGEPHQEKSFYANIDRASCEKVGLTVDPETVAWWSRQSREAEDALVREPQALLDVAKAFGTWWRDNGATYVWSNGANFDEVLWRIAAAAVTYSVPWKYWNVRDTRTCWHLARLNPKTIPQAGVAHNALADARHQALCVTRAYAILGVKPAAEAA